MIQNKGSKRRQKGISWDFGEEREPKIHRIHAYPAKFPAFLTSKAVKVAKSKGVNVERIADVFCGCGTTALEARRLGLDFWGCDINPVATLIARVKSESYQVWRLTQYKTQILDLFDGGGWESVDVRALPERLSYWFFEKDRKKLKLLLDSIRQSIPTGKYQDFFLCAFSNILKPVSRWLTKSIKPQIDPNKNAFDARVSFERQVAFMIKAVSEISLKMESSSKIETVNFLKQCFPKSLADIVITSPPYVTSYEYADLHQLSSMWLGYTDDYKKLRNGTIGSLYNQVESLKDVRQLNDAGQNIVFRLQNVDHRKAVASARYFRDMAETVRKCYQLLHRRGMVFFVIGNTEYKGVKVDNRAYLKKCLEQEKFEDIVVSRRIITGKTLTPYRDIGGRFTTDNTSRKVYAEEFIVMGRKP